MSSNYYRKNLRIAYGNSIRILSAALHVLFGFRGVCRHVPSCSENFKTSVINLGFVKGTWQGLGQLMRCHPLAKSGWSAS